MDNMQHLDFSAHRYSEAKRDDNSERSHNSFTSVQSHVSHISALMIKLQHGKKTIGQKLKKTKTREKS